MTRYGRLSVISLEKRHNGIRNVYMFRCICDCGKETVKDKAKVIGGQTRSCGCLAEETRKKFIDNISLPGNQSSINEVFYRYKRCAAKRGYSFELNIDEFKELVVKPCIYCGDSLTNFSRRNLRTMKEAFLYTGIDRYDNSLGYTVENSVPCCKICNRIKTNMSIGELEKHMIKMLNNSDGWMRTA